MQAMLVTGGKLVDYTTLVSLSRNTRIPPLRLNVAMSHWKVPILTPYYFHNELAIWSKWPKFDESNCKRRNPFKGSGKANVKASFRTDYVHETQGLGD